MTTAGGDRYALRRDGDPLWELESGGQPWKLTGRDGTHLARFELNGPWIRLQVLNVSTSSSELAMLILLCCYVLIVLGETRVPFFSGGGPGGG